MAAALAVLLIMSIVLMFMFLIAGIFEEIAAHLAIKKKMELEAAERKRKAEARRRAEMAYKANLRKTGHRFWGGYIGGSNF